MIYEKIKNLNEFQKKEIKERLELDFFKELNKIDSKKEKFYKVFLEKIEYLVNQFENKGILFYGIRIELPNSLEEINFWENIHIHVEEFINYVGLSIELVEFCYFSLEIEGFSPKWQDNNETKSKVNFEKKNFPYLSGIIGVRSLIGKNKFFLYEIKEAFNLSFFDVELKWLSSVSEVQESWNNIIKQKNFKFHRFVNYSDFYPMVYGSISDDELKFEGSSAFGLSNHFISDTMNVAGIQKKSPTKQEKFLYLINLYMIQNNLFIYEDSIFSKVTNSKISWQPIYNLSDMKSEIKVIFEKVKSYFFQQLSYFNVMDLMFNDLDSIFIKLNKINNLVPKINFFDSVIEFRNGIYFFETKKFLKFSDFESSDYNKYKTFYYINCDFSDSILIQKILNNLYHSLDKKKLKEILNNKN